MNSTINTETNVRTVADFSSRTKPGSLSWETCFSRLAALPVGARIAIRRGALESIQKGEGVDQIRPVDVDFEIFAAFRRNGGDLAQVLTEFASQLFG